MGILSVCFVAILAAHVPFIGRGVYAKGHFGGKKIVNCFSFFAPNIRT